MLSSATTCTKPYCVQDMIEPTFGNGKTHRCPENSVFTGARYLIYTSSALYSPQIGGLQLICSNKEHYSDPLLYYNDQYETAFLQVKDDFNGDNGNYKWSPYYVCPPGYRLNFQLNELRRCFGDDYTRSQYKVNWRYRCWAIHKMMWQTLHVQCVYDSSNLVP
eukprot:UN05549